MSLSEVIQRNRRENAKNLVSTLGAKVHLSRMLGYSGGHITLLINGTRTFTDEFASNIERLLGLPSGWMDEINSVESIPVSALEMLAPRRKSRGLSEAVELNRRENAKNLVSGVGAKARLSRMLGYTGGHVTLLLKGARTFIDEVARNIEQLLGLPEGWMDTPHAPESIPASALAAIQDECPVARPTLAPVRGRPSSLSRQTRTTEGHADELSPQTDPAAPIVAEAGAQRSAQPVLVQVAPEIKVQDEVQRSRHINFLNLTSQPGAPENMARLLGYSTGHVSFLLKTDSTFPDETAANVEKILKLPKGWMDASHHLAEIPSSVWLALLPERKKVRRPRASRRARPVPVDLQKLTAVLVKGNHNLTIRKKVKNNRLLSTLQVALLEKMIQNMQTGNLDDSMCLKLLSVLDV